VRVLMRKKIVSLFVILCLVLNLVPLQVLASVPDLYINYSGNRIDSGGSIHYYDSNVSFRVNFGMASFNLYVNGTLYSWTSNDYMDVTLDSPPTQVVFRAEHNGVINEITVNFYKNTEIDPNARYRY